MFVYCQECKIRFDFDRTGHAFDGEYFCSTNCVMEYLQPTKTKCAHCGETSRGNWRDNADQQICDACAADLLETENKDEGKVLMTKKPFCCDKCGDPITGTIHMIDGQDLCGECFRNPWERKLRSSKDAAETTGETKNRAEQLAEAHWGYIEQAIRTEYDGSEVEARGFIDLEFYLRRVGFHYRTAMVHGYKHGADECNVQIFKNQGKDGLKPCPFCGFNPEVNEDSGYGEVTFNVVCNARSGGCGASSGYDEDKVVAIAKWNRRKGGE